MMTVNIEKAMAAFRDKAYDLSEAQCSGCTCNDKGCYYCVTLTAAVDLALAAFDLGVGTSPLEVKANIRAARARIEALRRA